MTKGKQKQARMPAVKPAQQLYAEVLSSVLIRSQPYLTPTEFKAWTGKVRARDWLGLIQLAESFDNTEYVGVLDQYVKTQLVALVKKYPFTREEAPGFDPKLAAWKKFCAAEHRCKRVNQRSAALRNGDGFRYPEILRDMREYIYKVLGSKPRFSSVYDKCDFGPGASVGVTGDRTNLGRKLLSERWTVTRLALPYCTRALWQHEQIRGLIMGPEPTCYTYEQFAQRVAARARLVTHNNISFVPKTFKTERSIASEPLLNGFIQKGIDQYMRERLALHGLDLSDQEPNQLMARAGSFNTGNPYCTIDLSSASDSISSSIVKILLPPDWFDLLDRTRSHVYAYRGKHYVYHKFVSMGNGFCFPLQTLIFAAVAYACSKRHGSPVDFRVYGDDIILRRSDAPLALEVLRYLGFRHNPEKTFLFGPFRESCGTDWYGGLDIRPVYLDFRLENNTDLFKFHNSTLCHDLAYGIFTEARLRLRDACPAEVRFVRPYHGNADSAFTVERDVALSSPHVRWVRNRWAYAWKEVLTTPFRDNIWLDGYDPIACNNVEYLAVLRGSSTRVPLAVRRKTRASVRRKSYWGLPAEISWKGAYDVRGESP